MNLQQYLQDRGEEFEKRFEYKDNKNEDGFHVLCDRKDGFPASDKQIIEFNNETIQEALKMQAEEIESKIRMLKHEIQQDETPLGNEQWKEGHTECLHEALSIIENYK